MDEPRNWYMQRIADEIMLFERHVEAVANEAIMKAQASARRQETLRNDALSVASNVIRKRSDKKS